MSQGLSFLLTVPTSITIEANHFLALMILLRWVEHFK